MACCSFSRFGSRWRKRHTPLRSTADAERRRCFHDDFRSADISVTGLSLSLLENGYVISSRSPQREQRKFWLATSLRSPQAMQRKRNIAGRTPGAAVVDGGMGLEPTSLAASTGPSYRSSRRGGD